jgi:hypothetical protein
MAVQSVNVNNGVVPKIDDQAGWGAAVLCPCENAVLGRNVVLEVDAGSSKRLPTPEDADAMPASGNIFLAGCAGRSKRLPYIRNASRLG